MACPRCGVKGLDLGGELWKCWRCVVRTDSYADVEALERVLARGYARARLPDTELIGYNVAVLYRADGTDLTAYACEQGKAVSHA